jgi:hypothetical protein
MSVRVQQFGRVIRLFASVFAHSAWVGLIHMPWPSKTAIVGLAVAATEAGYRAVQPNVSTGLGAAQNEHLSQIVTQLVDDAVKAKAGTSSDKPATTTTQGTPPTT